MIDEIFEPGLQPAVIFAGNEDIAVGRRDFRGKIGHRARGFARRIVAEAPVEHGQVDRLGVDQLGAVAACGEGVNDPAGELDALPVAAIAAIKDKNVPGHAA